MTSEPRTRISISCFKTRRRISFCQSWVLRCERKIERDGRGKHRKRDQDQTRERKDREINLQTLKSFIFGGIFTIISVFLIFQAEQSPFADLLTTQLKMEISQKSLVVIADHSVFTVLKAAEILDFISRESQPITSLFPHTATFTYLKLSDEITRWQRSSCLSTVLSVYLLLEQEGRPNLHNSLPAAKSKDDSAQTSTPERGNMLHGAVCL